MNRSHAESLVWLLIIAGLAIGIGIELDWGRRWSYPVAQPEVPTPLFDKPALTERYSLPAADTFMEIALRPLFVATRRPAPTVVVEPPKPRMKKDQFLLTGTTLVPEGKFAHFIEKATNKTITVVEGKDVNGILVKEVKPDRVVLMQHDDTEIVMLKTAKAPSAAPPAPAPTNAPRPAPRTLPLNEAPPAQ